MIKGVLGINIAVHDLDAAVKKYEQFFGVKSVPSDPKGFAFPGMRGARFWMNGFRLNLITTDNPDTGVGRFLAKRGEGVFLVSAEADDIHNDIKALEEQGFNMLLKPTSEGIFGAVNFMHPKEMHGVQFEILQPANKTAVPPTAAAPA